MRRNMPRAAQITVPTTVHLLLPARVSSQTILFAGISLLTIFRQSELGVKNARQSTVEEMTCTKDCEMGSLGRVPLLQEVHTSIWSIGCIWDRQSVEIYIPRGSLGRWRTHLDLTTTRESTLDLG